MAELLEYKCPNCGGALEFNSISQKMKCLYCDSEFSMDELKALEENADDKSNETDTGEAESEIGRAHV